MFLIGTAPLNGQMRPYLLSIVGMGSQVIIPKLVLILYVTALPWFQPTFSLAASVAILFGSDRVCVYVCLPVWVYTSVSVCVSSQRVYVCLSVCLPPCLVCVFACVWFHLFVCVCVYVSACVCMYCLAGFVCRFMSGFVISSTCMALHQCHNSLTWQSMYSGVFIISHG